MSSSARRLEGLLVRTAVVTAVVTTLVCAVASRLIYNRTASLPLGWYWVEGGAPERGDLVALRVPASVERIVKERRYLPEGAFLVKTVVAMEGDEVCSRDGVFVVNGKALGRVLDHDSEGRDLPQAEVCGRVGPREVYVGSEHPQSFDSRAFGAVAAQDIKGKVKRLWTY